MSWRHRRIIMIAATAALVSAHAAAANARESQDPAAFIKSEALRCGVGELDVSQQGSRYFYVFPHDTESVELRPIGPPNEQQDTHWKCLAAAALKRHYSLAAPPVVWDSNGGAARATGAFWVAIANPAPSDGAVAPKNPDR